MDITTHALVLREVSYKESDKLLTVLTREHGKLTVTARACRKRNSPLAAAAQLLAFSEMTIYEFRGRKAIREANPEQLFWGVRGDVEKLALGSYFAELTELLTQEEIPAPELLSLMLNSLYAMDTLDKPLPQVKTAFEWKLMQLTGFEPMLDGCAVCGAEPEQPLLHLREGVLCCRSCRDKLEEGIAMPLSHSALEALRYILYGDPKRLFSFRLEQEELHRLERTGEAFVATQLERGFSTLDFYKKLKRL